MAQEVFPQFKLFTPVKVLCECIGATVGRFSMLPSVVDLSLSEHNRGASVALDEVLDA